MSTNREPETEEANNNNKKKLEEDQDQAEVLSPAQETASPSSPPQSLTEEEQGNTTPLETPEEREKRLDEIPTDWWLVFSLATFYFLTSGVENGLSSAYFTTFESHFNATTTMISAAQTTTEATKILGALASGHFASRFPVVWVCVGAVIWAIGTTVFLGGATGVWSLFVAYGINGLGFNFLSVLAPFIFEKYSHEDVRERVPFQLSICYSIAAVGVAIGFVLGGVTAEDGELWRVIFIIFGACAALPIIMLSRTTIKELCTDKEKLQEAFRDSMNPDLEYLPTFCLLLKDKTVVFIVLSQTMQLFYVNANIALLPKFIEEGPLQRTKAEAAFVLAATVPAVIIGSLVGGFATKKVKALHTLNGQMKFCLALNVLVIPLLCVFLSTSFAATASLLVLAMFCVFTIEAPSVTMLALVVDDQRHVPYVQSLVNIITRIGGVAGPLLLAVAIDNTSENFAFEHAYLTISLVGAFFAALFSLLAWWACPDEKRERDGHHFKKIENTNVIEDEKTSHAVAAGSAAGDINNEHYTAAQDAEEMREAANEGNNNNNDNNENEDVTTSGGGDVTQIAVKNLSAESSI